MPGKYLGSWPERCGSRTLSAWVQLPLRSLSDAGPIIGDASTGLEYNWDWLREVGIAMIDGLPAPV